MIDQGKAVGDPNDPRIMSERIEKPCDLCPHSAWGNDSVSEVCHGNLGVIFRCTGGREPTTNFGW